MYYVLADMVKMCIEGLSFLLFQLIFSQYSLRLRDFKAKCISFINVRNNLLDNRGYWFEKIICIM